MGKHRPDAAGAGLEAGKAEERVQPDQAVGRSGGADPSRAPRSSTAVALQPVGDEEHDRPLPEHAARPFAVELAERRGDPRAARPVEHGLRASGQRLVGIAPPDLAGDVGEARAEEEGADPALLAEGVDEVEEDARIGAHRAGDVAEDDDRRMDEPRLAVAKEDQVAAGPEARAKRPPRIDGARRRRGDRAARPHLVIGQAKALELALGLGDLGRGHLREIASLQRFAVRHRPFRLDLDVGRLRALPRRRLEQGFGDAARRRAAAAPPSSRRRGSTSRTSGRTAPGRARRS